MIGDVLELTIAVPDEIPSSEIFRNEESKMGKRP